MKKSLLHEPPSAPPSNQKRRPRRYKRRTSSAGRLAYHQEGDIQHNDVVLQSRHGQTRRTRTLHLPLVSLVLVLLSLPSFTAASNIFTKQAETPLAEPSCDLVGESLVCDIVMLLTDDANATTATPQTIAEATLECPWEAGSNLNTLDHRTCGCTAVLTPVEGTSDRPPRECTCHYCPSEDPSQVSPNLGIDCSQFTADPFVKGDCKAIDCEGTCVDKSGGNSTTATNAPDVSTNATMAPSSGNATTATTQAPTLPPTTQAPTLAPTNLTTAPTTQAPTAVPIPQSNSTTCSDFCPDNKRIPEANQDVVIDTLNQLTCAALEKRKDVVDSPEGCLQRSRYGALCCTDEDVFAQPEWTGEPTPPPTANGTEVARVDNSFLIYNTEGLTASVLMLGPELDSLSMAYAVFVSQVVWELGMALGNTDSSSPTGAEVPAEEEEEAEEEMAATTNTTANETRYLRTRSLATTQQQQQKQQQHQRRRLSVTLDSSSAHVYTIEDAPCPSTVPFNASCAVAYGTYDLLVFEEENGADFIASQYTNYTQESIDRGTLGDTLARVDPLSWVVVKEATDHLATINPNETEPTLSPQIVAEEGGYDEFFMIGIGLSIACIVVCLVGIICAADYSDFPMDDGSEVDPWDKESVAKSKASSRGKEMARKASSRRSDRKTSKQEYMMYRRKIEKLVMQKSPEEEDNIDELMDLFHQREQLLIATLEKMPDASENGEEEEEGEEGEVPPDQLYSQFNSSFVSGVSDGWDEGSSDEFAHETRDGSEEELEAAEEDEDDSDDEDEPFRSKELKMGTNTITEMENETDAEQTDAECETDVEDEAGATKPMLDSDHSEEEEEEEDPPAPAKEEPTASKPVMAEPVEEPIALEESDDDNNDDEMEELILEQETNTIKMEHAENMRNSGTDTFEDEVGAEEEWDEEETNPPASSQEEQQAAKPPSAPPKTFEEEAEHWDDESD